MTYWVDCGQYKREPFDSLVKARAKAVKILENMEYKSAKISIRIYSSKNSIDEVGKVWFSNSLGFFWTESVPEGYVPASCPMYKNGKLIR